MTKVIVLLDEDRASDMTATIQRLRERGLVVDQMLSAIHIVTGWIDEAELPSLRELDEVLGVRDDEAVNTRL